jgi:hypothetical protein
LAYAFLGYETTWCIKKKNFNRMGHVRRALENLYDVEPSLRIKRQTKILLAIALADVFRQ